MNPNILLQNLVCKNTIHYWFPSDSEERYEHNKKSHNDILSELNWNETVIEYKFDNLGFRNNENFNQEKKYNLILGCSFSFGIGVKNTDIWYNQLKSNFLDPFYNASVPGGSIGCCLRSLKGLIAEGMTIKRVFCLIPGRTRFEVYEDTSNGKGWGTVAWWTSHKKNIKHIVCNENFLNFHYQSVLDSLRYTCEKNNIEYVFLPSDSSDLLDRLCHNDNRARDLEHPGVEAQRMIGNIFYEKYNKLYKE